MLSAIFNVTAYSMNTPRCLFVILVQERIRVMHSFGNKLNKAIEIRFTPLSLPFGAPFNVLTIIISFYLHFLRKLQKFIPFSQISL